jgi:hypothetical protein
MAIALRDRCQPLSWVIAANLLLLRTLKPEVFRINPVKLSPAILRQKCLLPIVPKDVCEPIDPGLRRGKPIVALYANEAKRCLCVPKTLSELMT